MAKDGKPAQGDEVEKPKEERHRLYFVYIGVFKGAKVPKLYGYFNLNEEEFQSRSSSRHDGDLSQGHLRYYGKQLATASVGSIISVEAPVNQEAGRFTIFIDSARFEGRWLDSERVTKWRTTSDSFEAALRRAKDEKAERSRNEMLERLEPIRAAYRDCRDWKQQQDMLASILRYVTG